MWRIHNSFVTGRVKIALYKNTKILFKLCYLKFGFKSTYLDLAFWSWSIWSAISLAASCCFLRRADTWASWWRVDSSKSRRSFKSSCSLFLFNSIYNIETFILQLFVCLFMKLIIRQGQYFCNFPIINCILKV